MNFHLHQRRKRQGKNAGFFSRFKFYFIFRFWICTFFVFLFIQHQIDVFTTHTSQSIIIVSIIWRRAMTLSQRMLELLISSFLEIVYSITGVCCWFEGKMLKQWTMDRDIIPYPTVECSSKMRSRKKKNNE